MTIYEETVEQLREISKKIKVESIVMGTTAYREFVLSYPYPRPDILKVLGYTVIWEEDFDEDMISFISLDDTYSDQDTDDYTNNINFA